MKPLDAFSAAAAIMAIAASLAVIGSRIKQEVAVYVSAAILGVGVAASLFFYYMAAVTAWHTTGSWVFVVVNIAVLAWLSRAARESKNEKNETILLFGALVPLLGSLLVSLVAAIGNSLS